MPKNAEHEVFNYGMSKGGLLLPVETEPGDNGKVQFGITSTAIKRDFDIALVNTFPQGSMVKLEDLKEIAQAVGMNERTLYRHLLLLQKQGILKQISRGTYRRPKAN
jgi:hypothetical protein